MPVVEFFPVADLLLLVIVFFLAPKISSLP
jgi:hypothetical protein